ncbi:MAG: hypothetical protein EA383_11790 [Spirochaetaceae bacterium]|nr:MAG: hypothetical protein EA383_11790 [Spirochaetaceae bacterium]
MRPVRCVYSATIVLLISVTVACVPVEQGSRTDPHLSDAESQTLHRPVTPGSGSRIDPAVRSAGSAPSALQPVSVAIENLLIPVDTVVRPVSPEDDQIGRLAVRPMELSQARVVEFVLEVLELLASGDTLAGVTRPDRLFIVRRRVQRAIDSDALPDSYLLGIPTLVHSDDTEEQVIPVRLFRGGLSVSGDIIIETGAEGLYLVDLHVDLEALSIEREHSS